MTYEEIYTGMGIVGGLYAAVQVVHTLWKKMTKRVKVAYAIGSLYLEGGLPTAGLKIKSDNKLTNLKGILHIAVINEKDENVCITDIFGTFLYDKKRYDEKHLKDYGAPICFSIRPARRNPRIPINLAPKEAIDVCCTFELKEVNLDSLERAIPLASLPTYFLDDVPIVIFHPHKIETHWLSLPVAMHLSIHINGSELIESKASFSYKKDEQWPIIDDLAASSPEDDENYGTIDHITIMDIERRLCGRST
ncbi:MAG: hypothetical protein WC861_00415 [Candidatus Micrarchaeia archaeon]|jgi:hypothetical protein